MAASGTGAGLPWSMHGIAHLIPVNPEFVELGAVA
jgi:hypothetical protein